jgi:DNA processing protein
MATGIDTHAHSGALSVGGTTIAVLGSAIDRPYPACNRKLMDSIAASGAVVSEFPMGTGAEPGHFPQRNRVISGLSYGVVVIEAAERSGALSTARCALEQNREVFALPGPYYSGASAGTHLLIREGAVLVRTPEDVLSELPPAAGICPVAAPDPAPFDGDLPADALAVLACLEGPAPCHVDRIARETGFPTGRALALLLDLEMDQRVEQLPGKRFARARK